jgi:hypothetical protein
LFILTFESGELILCAGTTAFAGKCIFTFGMKLFLPLVDLVAFYTQFTGYISGCVIALFEQPNCFFFEGLTASSLKALLKVFRFVVIRHLQRYYPLSWVSMKCGVLQTYTKH